MKLDGCRGGFILEGYSVRYENEINIVAVGSTRFFDLGVEEDGVVYDFVDVAVCWFEVDDEW